MGKLGAQAIGKKVLVEVEFDETTYEDYVVDEQPVDINAEFSKGLLLAGKVVTKTKLTETNRCKVLSVGREVLTNLEVGKRYIFNQKMGIKISYGGKEYLLLDGDNDFYLNIG